MRLGYEFGHYWIEELLHCDEVVQVCLAYHLQSGKTVVLTHLPADFLHDADSEMRFYAMMEDAARIEHPAVAAPMDCGIVQGVPYAAHSYYAGGTLMQQIRAKGLLSLDETVDRLADVAAAVDALHQQGFLHFGLHPNVLLRDEADQLAVSGIGLAEICYQIAGIRTPMLPYTAPEVFLRAPATTSIDIYSLGVIAYQMLTGRLPYEGVTSTQMLRGHLNKPVDEHVVIPKAVYEVLKKAMAKTPSARYRSAGEFTAALEAAADNGTTDERSATRDDDYLEEDAPRIWESAIAAPTKIRWAKTQAVAGNPNLGQLYVEALMTEQKDPAEAVRRYQRIVQLWPHFAQGEVTERLHRLEQSLGEKRVPSLMAHMTTAAGTENWHEVEDIGREVLSYKPDHAAALYLYTTALRNNTAYTHYRSAEVAAKHGLWPITHKLLSELAAFDPAFEDRAGLRVIHQEVADFVTRTIILQAHHEPVLSLAFSPDSLLLATGSTDRNVRLWGVPEWVEIDTISEHHNWVSRILFSADSQSLYAGTWDGDVNIWKMPDAEFGGVIAGQAGQVRDMAYLPKGDGGLLATASGYFLTLWSMPDGERTAVIREHDRQPITSVTFANGGRWLVTGTNHGHLRVRETEHPDAPVISDVALCADPIYALAASPDGRWAAAACRDGVARMQNLADPTSEIIELRGHQGTLRTITFSAEGSLVATAGQDGQVLLWRSHDGRMLKRLTTHAGTVNSLAFSPDGTSLAAGAEDGTVTIWRLV